MAVHCRYLQEYAALGTGGGIYHFRDQIVSGSPEAFFVLNADVCSAFPLTEMFSFQKEHGEPNSFVILGTTVRFYKSNCLGFAYNIKLNPFTFPHLYQANRTQSLNYGCIVENEQTNEVTLPSLFES